MNHSCGKEFPDEVGRVVRLWDKKEENYLDITFLPSLCLTFHELIEKKWIEQNVSFKESHKPALLFLYFVAVFQNKGIELSQEDFFNNFLSRIIPPISTNQKGNPYEAFRKTVQRNLKGTLTNVGFGGMFGGDKGASYTWKGRIEVSRIKVVQQVNFAFGDRKHEGVLAEKTVANPKPQYRDDDKYCEKPFPDGLPKSQYDLLEGNLGQFPKLSIEENLDKRPERFVIFVQEFQEVFLNIVNSFSRGLQKTPPIIHPEATTQKNYSVMIHEVTTQYWEANYVLALSKISSFIEQKNEYSISTNHLILIHLLEVETLFGLGQFYEALAVLHQALEGIKYLEGVERYYWEGLIKYNLVLVSLRIEEKDFLNQKSCIIKQIEVYVSGLEKYTDKADRFSDERLLFLVEACRSFSNTYRNKIEQLFRGVEIIEIPFLKNEESKPFIRYSLDNLTRIESHQDGLGVDYDIYTGFDVVPEFLYFFKSKLNRADRLYISAMKANTTGIREIAKEYEFLKRARREYRKLKNWKMWAKCSFLLARAVRYAKGKDATLDEISYLQASFHIHRLLGDLQMMNACYIRLGNPTLGTPESEKILARMYEENSLNFGQKVKPNLGEWR